MRGWIIYDELLTSRRFNRLLNHPLGEFAQNIYMLSYSLIDFWGHLPFDYEWIQLKVVPGNKKSIDDIKTAMVLLVLVKLWELPYKVNNNFYIYVFNFENLLKSGLRKRTRGCWPDESGEIPKKDPKTLLDEDIKNSSYTREKGEYYSVESIPEYSGIFRNVTEEYRIFQSIPEYSVPGCPNRTEQNRTEHYKTGTATAGFFDSFPQIINISGKEIRKTYLIKLFHECGDDLDQALRVLFRAKDANNPIAYIEKGLSEGFAYEPVSMEYDNPAAVRAWIDTLCGIPCAAPTNSKPKPNTPAEPSSIGDIIKTLSQ